jgi:hypothetical protein
MLCFMSPWILLDAGIFCWQHFANSRMLTGQDGEQTPLGRDL